MLSPAQIQKTTQLTVAISDKMVEAQKLWHLMYINQSPWLDENIKGLNLPASISAEIIRVAVNELKVKMEDDNERAKFLLEQYTNSKATLYESLEMGAAKGGLIIKPFVSEGKMSVEYIQMDACYPMSFDSNKRITSCIFEDKKVIGKTFYTKLEIHTLGQYPDEKGLTVPGYKIENKAYKSDVEEQLGTECNLSEVPEWSKLAPVGIIKNVTKPLFGYFKYPLANNKDVDSPLGVSCFSRAEAFIEQADENWELIQWELQSARRALYVDELAFEKDAEDHPILPDIRLYRTIKNSGNVSEEDMFHDWSPAIRIIELEKGQEAIYRKIEFAVGLDYGRISNPQTIDKTATEIQASQQRFFSTITNVQREIEQAHIDFFYAMDVWVSVAKLVAPGKYSLVCTFDDSIITDTEAKFNQNTQALGIGVMSKVEWRMVTYKEDEATAKKKVLEALQESIDEQKALAAINPPEDNFEN